MQTNLVGPLGPAITVPLPPDLLRLINSDLPVKEILQRCTINKQFYNAVCQSKDFWTALARQRNIPENQIVGKDIKGLQQLIAKREERSRLFDINRLTLPDPQIGEPRRDILNGNYTGLELHAFARKILEKYRQLNGIRERVKPVYRPGVVVPQRPSTQASYDEFNKRFEEMLRKLRRNDILRVDYTEYIVDQRNRLSHFAGATPHVTALLLDIYEANGQQPLTHEMVREYFPADVDVRRLYQFVRIGDFNDPVQTFRGVPIHTRQVI